MYTKLEIAVLALHKCGGAHTPIDTEDVAVKASELSPGLFAWNKYPEQINLELVRVHLSNAKKTENGNLVVGSGSKGWSLSSAGVSWVASNSNFEANVGSDPTRASSQSKSPDEQRWRRERLRLMETQAYESWSSGKLIEPNAATEVFRIDSYSDGDLIQRKIARLVDLFEKDDLEEFLLMASAIVQGQQN